MYKITYFKRYTLVSKENNKPTLKELSYKELLLDEKWKYKRLEILKRDNNKCVVCQSNDNLNVHHRQYHFLNALGKFKNPWEYPNDILITLCKSCHQQGHSKYKVPIKYI